MTPKHRLPTAQDCLDNMARLGFTYMGHCGQVRRLYGFTHPKQGQVLYWSLGALRELYRQPDLFVEKVDTWLELKWLNLLDIE